MPLLLGFAPGIVAKEACRSRETIVRAFNEYMRKGGLDFASGMIEARRKINKDELTLSDDDFVRAEITNALGVFGNIIPTSFWMLFHIYSKRELLGSLRAELLPLVAVDKQDNRLQHTLDVSGLRSDAPRLLSFFQELIRVRSTNASVRFVEEDILLANQYLLKKGNIVQMPSAVLHRDQSSWGKSMFIGLCRITSGSSQRQILQIVNHYSYDSLS